MQRKKSPFGLRLPEDLKKWVVEKAEAEGRSINMQVVQIIKQARDGRMSAGEPR